MPRNARVIAAAIAVATGFTIAVSRPLVGQNPPPIEADCDGDVLGTRTPGQVGPQYELTPNRVWGRLILQRTGHDFAEMGDSARAVFDVLAVGMDAVTRGQMTVLLDSLRAQLVRTDTDAIFRVREGPSARMLEIDRGDTDSLWRVGVGADTIAITTRTPESTRRAVCWTALLGRRIADHGGQEARRESLKVLAARERRWSNFERNGYSLTPLELLVNGWCGACRDELEPPRVQIIAAHMLPSYLVRSGSGSRAALTSELGGLLFYSPSRSFHWGGSVVLAFPQEQRREIGIVLHVSTIGQIGVTAPSWSFSQQRSSLLLSADLYRFIERWRGTLKDERDAVRRGVAKAGG